MKVVIAGSRGIDDHTIVNLAIELSGFEITQVVSGHARGADTYGEVWAVDNNIEIKEFLPEYQVLGKAAGILRNADMAEYADAAVVVWDGKSPGSKNMIEQMKQREKPCFVYKTDGEYYYE